MAKKQQQRVTEAASVRGEASGEQTGGSGPEVLAAGEVASEEALAESVPVVTLDVGAGALVARSHPIESEVPAAPTKKGKGRRAKGDLTLAELAEKYLAHLETAGKSSGTCFSYKLELSVALDQLGAETKVAELTSERVMVFFGSERVTQTRTGRAKSPLSIDKTRRVLRQALVYAASKGFIEKAPLPEDAATH